MAIPTEVATKKTVGAGTQLAFKVADAFKVLKGLETVPQVGGNAEWEETTRVDDTERQYTEKLPTPQEVELVYDDLPNDEVQTLLFDEAELRGTVEAEITYANGRIARFNLELMDHYQGEADKDQFLMHAVKGRLKQIAWDKVA